MYQNVCILLGSNLGDAFQQLNLAVKLLEQRGVLVIKMSSIYQTAAWGKLDQPAFLNQALLCSTELTPQDLLKICLLVEEEMGRIRHEKWAARIIDIDIILFGDLVVSSPNLQIPHPFLPQRRFSLIPLVELMPDFIHPVLKKSMIQLLQECPDELEVKMLS